MFAEGKVSLWLGTAPSFEVLEEYIAPRFTDDGDLIRSGFAIDFELPLYEEGLREAIVLDEPATSLRSLLAGVSYEDVVIPAFVRLLGDALPESTNAAVLIYELAYDGGARDSRSPVVTLRASGVVAYPTS